MRKNRSKVDRIQSKLVDESKEIAESQISGRLGSVIKSARNIMRKDKGLSGDLDRLPMLTWIMFLKFLDDVEQHREVEAALKGEPYVSTIEPPYRWRDWATGDKGLKGDDLIAFIGQEEAILPNGTKGPGLFSYLRSLRGTDDTNRRDVIAAVFRETYNRMISGYLLSDVLNLIDTINFGSSKQIHVMGRMYETMLKQLRDAAGDSGEFYTPRSVIRFMVESVRPQLGETILDPAAGTGGFLTESFEYLKRQCHSAKDMTRLQKKTLFGIEAKPLPYLLCQMNLVLHGIESPNIELENALGRPLREIGDKDRVDIILTNPPFGGEEERGILRNFPRNMQTTDTALLFLQLVMRRLRRSVHGKQKGRCGIIVPDGVLFQGGVASRVRKSLLEEFNLHTILKLPEGTFAPYTIIKTNILFFGKNKQTTGVWFYEHKLPEGRKNYTKTKPLHFEEFAPCLKWWHAREENEQAWFVKMSDIASNDYSFDFKNPNTKEVVYEHPLKICKSLLEKEERILALLNEVRQELQESE